MAGGISVHGVDVARGVPAAGMAVELWRLEPVAQRLACGELGANGAWDIAEARAASMREGAYELRFHAGAYFRRTHGEHAPCLFDVVPFRLLLADLERHYHLPLKITPWGYALFLGA